MSGGKWDFNQHRNPVTNRVEWPTGDLTLTGKEIPKRVEAWVLQRSTGASQRTFQTAFGVPGRWTADTPGWVQGTFQAGAALGIALVTSLDPDTNADAFSWWVDQIDLN
jgi:hypothetical protein